MSTDGLMGTRALSGLRAPGARREFREYARLGAAYLVIRTDAGWRFNALIITPPA
jgi:hypothetical protein